MLLLAAGAYTNRFGFVVAIATLALGLFGFSFVEYAIHRWLFHGRAGALAAGHDQHHVDPLGYDALPFFAPPLGMLALAALLATFLPGSTALLLAGAVAVGYAAYGLGHTAIHFRRFRWRWPMRWAAHHHIHHRHAESNFGVTTSLWDHVLGTRYVPARERAVQATQATLNVSIWLSPSARRAGLLIGVAILATLAVPILLGGRDALVKTMNFPASSYAVLLALLATSWFARALKLHVLLQRIGTQQSFGRTLLMSLAIDFAFIGTPAGVGGYAASIYYVRRSGTSTSAATTVTAVDQLLDLAFFALILPLAGLSLLWSELPTSLAVLAFVTSALMIALGVAAFFMRRSLVRWLVAENMLVRRWPRLRRRQASLRKFFASLNADVRLLMSGGISGVFGVCALTALQWVTRYGILWAALMLLGHHVSYALTLLLQSLILHAALWTGVPSGGGGAEVGLSAALAAWVPATSMATALLLWRLVTFDVCLIAGLAAAVLLARRRVVAESTNAAAGGILESVPAAPD
ncbi:MAG: flippase-like domain-containing protein [Rudaea sp.]